MDPSGGECSIKVVCRFRPLNDSEERAGSNFIAKFPQGSEDALSIGVSGVPASSSPPVLSSPLVPSSTVDDPSRSVAACLRSRALIRSSSSVIADLLLMQLTTPASESRPSSVSIPVCVCMCV